MKANHEAKREGQPTPLMLAVIQGQTLELDALIDVECNMHATDDEGATALHIAATKQRLEIIECLFKRGARPEVTDKWGFMPIHRAARAGEHEAVAKLVELHAPVSSRTAIGRQTALHLAATADELETIRVLVAARANMSCQDNRGFTAVHAAVESERIRALTLLLQSGVDPDLLTKAEDSALHLAVLRKNVQLTHCIIGYHANVDITGRNGQTPMHFTAEIGYTPALQVLLDPEHRDKETRSSSTSDTAPVDPVAQLRPANPNARDDMRQTPLHIAAWHGRHKICQLLINARCVVDASDAEGSTPMSLAIRKDHDATVKALLRLTADPLRRNNQGFGPLQQACSFGAVQVAKALTDMKMYPQEQEKWKKPLALAKFYGHEDIVAIFFKPCPKNLLQLHMPRGMDHGVAATVMAVDCEPALTALKLQVAESASVPVAGCAKRATHAPSDIAWTVQRDFTEDVWTNGYSLSVDGLLAGTKYVLRLVAESPAGVSYGDFVEVESKCPGRKRSSVKSLSRVIQTGSQARRPSVSSVNTIDEQNSKPRSTSKEVWSKPSSAES
jgi:ankyrin repeat protein